MKIQWVNKGQEGIPSWTWGARDGHWQPEDIRKLGRKRSGKLQILLNGESGSMMISGWRPGKLSGSCTGALMNFQKRL